MRQTGGGVCRLRQTDRPLCFSRGEENGKVVELSSKTGITSADRPQYRKASAVKKSTLLDAFTATTGYHRKYARWLLNHAEEVATDT